MINIGNKKIKKLKRGNDTIVSVHKGDELVFRDLEALYGWKFTIDTTLTISGTHNTNSTFVLKRNASAGMGDVPIKIDWGDGTEETVTLATYNGTRSHTYSSPGTYQICIVPTVFNNGVPVSGWLSGINAIVASGIYQNNNDNARIISIDKPFPTGSLLLSLSPVSGTSYLADGISRMFHSFYNIQSYPANLLDYTISPTDSGKMYFSFSHFGKNTGCDPFPLAKKWLDTVDYSAITNFTEMFQGAFTDINPSSKAIPADLFSSVDTSSGTKFQSTFEGLFSQCSAIESVPASLFSSISTVNGTNFKQMFKNAFGGVGYDSTTITLPASLFSSIDTSNGTTFEGMFAGAFSSFGYNSTSITIPETLFSTIDTSKGTTLGSGSTGNGMFSQAFQNFGYCSTVLTIPERLFEAISSPVCTEFRNMFYNTFMGCGRSSTVGEIPEKLFWSINTSNITNFSYMFSGTFSDYAYSHPKQLPAGIFSRLNTSNGVNFSSTFTATFSNTSITNIPAIFANLDTTNATSLASTFASTFSRCNPNSEITIPSNLFDLSTSNCKNFSGTFASTFESFSNGRSNFREIPATLFSYIDTSNGENFQQMFSSTFRDATISQGTLPNTIFSGLDTSKGRNFSSMFYFTFYEMNLPDVAYDLTGMFDGVKTPLGTSFDNMFGYTFSTSFARRIVTIPANLFQYVDTSNATTVSGMFDRTFYDAATPEIPAGLFGSLKLPSGLSDNSYRNLFYQTFSRAGSASLIIPVVLGDVFSGMSNFSWVNASNAANILVWTFRTTTSPVDQTSGTANAILQHFNFTPTSRTRFFEARTGLSDYNSINANWK